tara:strand:- start:196 stop:429 length:234 start_codon:yes stop_codon:yes gene_type:complete
MPGDIDDEWQIQKYRVKLRHDLKLALLKRRYDFRAQLKKEFWLSYYMVDTRRDVQSEDEKSRDDLDDRLLMKGIYDG